MTVGRGAADAATLATSTPGSKADFLAGALRLLDEFLAARPTPPHGVGPISLEDI
jgi:hypothetical protein